MKYAILISLAAVLAAGTSHAQTRIFRCGNTYTNDASEAQARNCKPIDGGNITVIQGTRVSNPPAGARPAAPASTGTPAQRVESSEQRARDADARQILEAELKKAEERHAELAKEYNNGQPERQGAEARNYQKYLDRVADLKAAITRNEADIEGIRRELSRLTATR